MNEERIAARLYKDITTPRKMFENTDGPFFITVNYGIVVENNKVGIVSSKIADYVKLVLWQFDISVEKSDDKTCTLRVSPKDMNKIIGDKKPIMDKIVDILSSYIVFSR